jgi:hypothetical protein
MRYTRILLHATILPKIYVAYLLISNAPNRAKDGFGLSDTSYKIGVTVLLLSLFALLYASFITGKYKWLPIKTRQIIAWMFIITLLAVDSAIIYYLLSISATDEQFLTLL